MSGNLISMVNSNGVGSPSFRVTIPRALAESLGLDDGLSVYWLPVDNHRLLLKVVVSDNINPDNVVFVKRFVNNLNPKYFTFRVSLPLFLADRYCVDHGEKWFWTFLNGDLCLERLEKK